MFKKDVDYAQKNGMDNIPRTTHPLSNESLTGLSGIPAFRFMQLLPTVIFYAYWNLCRQDPQN